MSSFSTDDYVQYRISRSRETLAEVSVHIENGYWNTAINRMYYACFYAVSALLVKHGIEVTSHSGARQKFGEHFVKSGIISRDLARHFADLFDKRQKADYDDFWDFDEDTARRLYHPSVELIDPIEAIIKG